LSTLGAQPSLPFHRIVDIRAVLPYAEILIDAVFALLGSISRHCFANQSRAGFASRARAGIEPRDIVVGNIH